MSFLTSFLGQTIGAAGSRVFASILEQLSEGKDELSMDQLVAIGIVKSKSFGAPIHPDLADAIASMGEDFETLCLNGFSSKEAHEMAMFIYAPRLYLIQRDHLPKEFVLDFDDERVKNIVDNALLNYLDDKGINPNENFNYNVASVEKFEFIDMEEILEATTRRGFSKYLP